MSYQDIKNLIGLTYEENGKDYKIVGIKDVTEDYITLDIELVQEEKISWNGKLLVDIGHGGTKTVNGKTVRDYGAENSITKMNEFVPLINKINQLCRGYNEPDFTSNPAL